MMSSDEESPEKKGRADERRMNRQKHRAIASSTYVPTILETAKDALSRMQEPSLESLIEREDFRDRLDEETSKKVKIFIQNLKQKNRKQLAEHETQEIKDNDLTEKVKSFVNKRIDKLHQSILIPQSAEERARVILEAIEKNIYDFLEYIVNFPSPTQDFHRIIISLKDQLEEDSFTTIFVRVCEKNGGDPLVVTPEMVRQAMHFLVEVETNQQSAYGLLRLVQINQLSLSTFDIDLLLSFQRLYNHAIIRVFKSIGIKDDEIIPLLPPTCFLFTLPMLTALKAGGCVLHEKLPPNFLPYILEIVCYSFTESQDDFDEFLRVMKEGCKKHLHKLMKSDFSQLLKAIAQCTVSRRKGFFRTLTQACKAVQRVFILLEEKKIDTLDTKTIDVLLQDDEDGFELINQRPKIVQSHSKDELLEQLQELVRINGETDFPEDFLDQNLSASNIPAFFQLGITNLLVLQNLCYQFCVKVADKNRWYIQYQTGQGKTALCLAIAVFYSSLGRPVYIVNDSYELTFRDFKKAKTLSQQIGTSFILCNESFEKLVQKNMIIYCTFEALLASQQVQKNDLPEGSTIIVDEFDSILFENKYTQEELAHTFSKAYHCICLTGSEIQEYHRSFISKSLDGSIVNFSPKQDTKIDAQCLTMKICLTKKDFLQEIAQQCAQITVQRPVVLIADDHATAISKAISCKGIPVEGLFQVSLAAVDSAMSTFVLRQLGRYSVYITTFSQGRGVDFPSSQEIEKNGGVHVLIAALPNFYLQMRQFIGRTARIGNKGSYSMVVLDKSQKNSAPEVFFRKKIEELKNNDVIGLSKIEVQQLKTNQDESKNKTNQNDKEGVPNESSGEINRCQLVGNNNNVGTSIQKMGNSSSNSVDDIKMECTDEKLIQATGFETENEIENQSNNKREGKQILKEKMKDKRNFKQRKPSLEEVDQAYFRGYEDPEIHKEMLQDEARVEAYRTALNSLSVDKVVIDVGAGTGILSLMAMDAGARCVYALEYSSIAKQAEIAFSKRKEKSKMMVFKGLAEEFTLGNYRADLIVSEWMGYFLINEHMLPSVIAVRDKWLKKEGLIIPQRASLLIACYSADDLKMSADQEERKGDNAMEAIIGECRDKDVVSTICSILELDLLTTTFTSNTFQANVKTQCIKDARIFGIVSWFNCLLAPGSALDTSPFSKPTHWKQMMFPFSHSYICKKDELLTINVDVKPLPHNHRALSVDFKVVNEESSVVAKQVYTTE